MRVFAVDLFCGAGGLTCGLQQSGIKVLAGIDFDGNCRYAYEHNNRSKFIETKIQDTSAEQINALYPSKGVEVLVGCAPCQTFSTHVNKISQKIRQRDERWSLLNQFARLIKDVHPDIVSMENVPMLSRKKIFKDFLKSLCREGYSCSWSIVYCPQYGIPQNRRRLVLLASLYGDIKLLPPTHDKEHYVVVKDVIGNLTKIEAGGCDPKDSLHRACRLSDLNMMRIKQSIPGGTWRDWNSDLLTRCHKKLSGRTYASVYSRMLWDEPAPTITTEFYSFGTGRFGHPEQDRAISLREGALLQTFPSDYCFVENDDVSIVKIGKMIGNAVPVRLGYMIGRSILKHLKEYGV